MTFEEIIATLPKPYYQDESVAIYHSDCRLLLPLIPDKSIDLVLTDPPYIWNDVTGGIIHTSLSDDWGYGGMLRQADVTAGLQQIGFDEWMPLVEPLMEEDSEIYVFSNDKNIHKIVNEMANQRLRLHNILVWKKNNVTPNHWYMKNCEFIVFGFKGRASPIRNISCSHFFDVSNVPPSDKLHPTEKPIILLLPLIENSSGNGQLILDPFLGSGTTAYCAKKLGRKCIGIEIEEKYCEIAAKRCCQTVMKLV